MVKQKLLMIEESVLQTKSQKDSMFEGGEGGGGGNKNIKIMP